MFSTFFCVILGYPNIPMRLLSLLSFLVFSGFPCTGQVIDHVGFRAGMGLSNMHVFNADAMSHPDMWGKEKLIFCAYAQAEKRLTANYSLRMELGYHQKGVQGKTSSVDNSGNAILLKNSLLIHNLSLHLGLKIFVGNKKVKPYFLFGAQEDFILSNPQYKSDFEVNTVTDNLKDIKNYSRFSISGVVAFGLQVNEKWSIELNFIPISSRVLDMPLKYSRDRSFRLSLGYFIR